MRFSPIQNVLTLVIGAVLLISVSCNDAAKTDDTPIRIGLLLPFTGEDAAIGSNYEHAVLMVKNEINRNGGINGHRVDIVTRDTHSTVAGAMASLQDLIAEPVLAVIGPESTDIARAILPTLQKKGIILLSPVVSGGDSIVLDATYKWYRLSPSASILGRSFANQIWSEGVSTISLVYSSGDYNLDFIGALSSRFIKRGGVIEHSIFLKDDAFTYGQEIPVLLRGDSRSMVLSASVTAAARFVNELTTSSSAEQWTWYLSPLLETPVFPQNTFPDAVEGAIGVGIDVPGYDESFRHQYASTWNTEPLDGAFHYYDATALLLLSLEQTAIQDGILTPAGIQEAIENVAYRQGFQIKWNGVLQGLNAIRSGQEISYTGLSGPILFSADGQQQIAPLKYWTIEDGEVVDNEI